MSLRPLVILPLAALMVALGLLYPARAQEPGDCEDYIVTIGSRTFLLGEPPRNAGRINGFLPLSSIGWIQDIVRSDPLLGSQGSVLSISERPSSPAYLFGPEGTPARFGSRDLVPEYFRQPALRVEVSPEDTPPIVQYLYMPEGMAPEFLTVFAAAWNRPDKDWVACGLDATSPPAREITLEARIYRPTAPSTFGTTLPATAARLQEIVACLDVTDDPPRNHFEADARLAAVRAAHPTLAGCAMALPS